MKHYTKLVRPYLIWSLLIIIIPLLMIVVYSVTTGGNTLVNIQFTLDSFKKFAEPVYLQVFLKSFQMGLITVGFCFFIGYFLAYTICRFSEHAQNYMILLVTIPMWINTLLRTYAWIGILSDNGILNTILEKLGFSSISFMYTDFAVTLGMVSDFLPFMVIPIYTSLSKIDHSLIEAAHDLGANNIQTFFKVTFKLSIPGVVKLLGGGQYMLIGNLIESQFISVGNWNFGSAISVILAVVILVAITIMRKIDPEKTEDE